MKKMLICFLLFFGATFVSLAQNSVTGKVQDASGKPLERVSVTAGGKTTITDANGNFTIVVPNGGKLKVTSVGYIAREVSANAASLIVLTNDVKVGEELIVTALGAKKEKKSLGYSVSTVNRKDLESRPEGDIARVLTGKAAGVNVLNSSGISGSGTNITIRAVSTITGNSTPLFIVDGVPFDGGTNNQTGFTYGNQTSSRFLDLDPNNIENVSILKGLSATTIYGELGRNGVILITTKNGSGANRVNKKAEISVSQSLFINSVANLPEYNTKYGGGFDLSNGVTFFSNWGGAFSNPPVMVPHPYDRPALNAAFPQYIGATYAYKNYANSVKNFFRKGNVSNTSINIGGSNANASYNGNFSYLDDNGFLPGNDLKKMSFGIGGNVKLSNKFTFLGAFNFVNTKMKSPPTSTSFGSSASNASAFGDVLYTPTSVDLMGLPWENPLDHSHVYYRSNNGIQNPRWTLVNSFTGDDVSRFFGNMQLKYELMKNFNLTYRVGFDAYTENQLYAQNKGGSYTPDGIYRTSTGNNNIWDQTVLGNYNTQLNKKIKLNLEGGVNVRNDIYSSTGITSSKQLVYGLLSHGNFIDHQSTAEDGSQLQYKSELQTIGAFGFATFNYLDYLFLNVGGRESWTSALEKNNRSIFYPSANLSFIPTAVIPSLMDNKYLNYLKLRLAYGTSAEFPGVYSTRPSLGIATKVFVDNSNTSINTNSVSSYLPNLNLKPALFKEFEFGTEARFIDNRLSLDLSLYNRTTKDQILNRDLDPSTGFTTQTINAGNVNNKGVEMGLGYAFVRNKTWKVQFDGFYTKNRSMVSGIPTDLKQIRTAGYTNLGTFAMNNQPLGVIMGTSWKRADNGQRIVGTTGDYITDPTIKILGDPTPKYKLTGIGTIGWKSLSLRVQMEYTKGGSFYSATSSVLLGRGVTRDTEFDRALPYILPGVLADKTPNNIQISATQAYFNNTVAGGAADEAGIYDGTNIRIREASLSYSLPQKFLTKMPFGAVSFSLSGTNLWYFAPNFPKYVHFDPETSGLGVSNGRGLEFFTGPSSRRVGATLRVTF